MNDKRDQVGGAQLPQRALAACELLALLTDDQAIAAARALQQPPPLPVLPFVPTCNERALGQFRLMFERLTYSPNVAIAGLLLIGELERAYTAIEMMKRGDGEPG